MLVLHEMPAGIVGDHRVGDAVLAQFPGGQSRALVQGPGFVHPHMHIDAAVKGGIDRGGGRAVFDAGQPPGIAVGEDVDRPVGLLAYGSLRSARPREAPIRRQFCTSSSAMSAAACPAAAHPFFAGTAAGENAAAIRSTAQTRLTAVGRAARIRSQAADKSCDRVAGGQVDPIGGSHPDQGGSPDHHFLYGKI